jgi:hypothetical protein
MSGSGKKFNEITQRPTSLEEHGFSLLGIKEWRTQELNAGRPSSLDDFFRIHGVCAACKCYGLQITGWDEEERVPLWAICAACRGTGRVPALAKE